MRQAWSLSPNHSEQTAWAPSQENKVWGAAWAAPPLSPGGRGAAEWMKVSTCTCILSPRSHLPGPHEDSGGRGRISTWPLILATWLMSWSQGKQVPG